MDQVFFYGTILLLWILFLIMLRKKEFQLRHLLMWITYSLYTLTYEIVFGEIFHLYHYIHPADSILYILMASFLLYPVIIMLYLFFLPEGKKVVWYSAAWIVLIQILEWISLYTKTIILTGWRIIPWSPLTYIATYLGVYYYNLYLRKMIPDGFRK